MATGRRTHDEVAGRPHYVRKIGDQLICPIGKLVARFRSLPNIDETFACFMITPLDPQISPQVRDPEWGEHHLRSTGSGGHELSFARRLRSAT
jgi:hypothetical protein